MLVHSNGIDKISPYQKTKFWKIKDNIIEKGTIKPSEFGFRESNSENYFKGGTDAMSNAQTILEILMNIEQGPIKDFILVHSATLAVLANLVSTPEEGMAIMRESIESGKALEQLNNYVRMSNKYSKINFLDRIISRRKLELNIKMKMNRIQTFDFLDTETRPMNCYEILKNNSINIIGEIKRSSPSEGNINSDININEVVTDYINGSVTGISILTENVWFGGSLKDIKSVRNQIENIPNRPFILRKDFIFSRYQVFEAYIAGADTLLLIASLEKHMIEYETSLKDLILFSQHLGMEPIVEIYDIDELEQSITSLPDNYPTAKRKLREEYNPKVLALNDEILGIKQEIGDLKVGLIETGVDVGPAIYLARAFGTDVDSVVKFFIFILIFVFDPLAVMLVIAYNQALMNRTTRDEDEAPAGGSIIIESASAYELSLIHI